MLQGCRTPVGCSAWALPHLHVASRFDDIDLPSAVKYLIASDPNLQVLGAAYLQHKCYSDSNAKKQVSTQELKEMCCLHLLCHGGVLLGGWRRWREAQMNWRGLWHLNLPGLSPPRPEASRPCPSW